MSYCVHCGVELGATEAECPLCNTPVLDPNRRSAGTDIPLFPNRVDIPNAKINPHFLAYLIGILLLFPLAVVILLDMLANQSLTWSIHVLGEELCLWSFIVLPFNCPGKSTYLYIGVDMVTVAAYILLTYFVSNGSGWYTALALPLIGTVGCTAFLATWICTQKKSNKIEKSGWMILLLSTFVGIVDLVIHHYIAGVFGLTWAWCISIPLMVFGIVLLIISRSAVLCDWIRRNLFI